jgi:hypothetical protein
MQTVYRNPPTKPTKTALRRSSLRMACDLVLAVALLGIATIPVVVLASWITWIASIFLSLFGIGMLMLAFEFPGVADCPGCGKKMYGFSLDGDNIGHQCEGCRLFVSSHKGQVMPLPEHWSAIIPTFGVVVGGAPSEPPEICCVCAAPATRKLPVLKDKKPYLDMPHCAEHEGGARAGKHGHDGVVYVRSLAFARAWAAMRGHEVVGNNRIADKERGIVPIPWLHGLVSLGIFAFGVSVHALLGWAEESGSPIVGNALMVLLYAIFGKKVLAGIFVSVGTFALYGFVMRLYAVMRVRLGIA